MAKRKTGSAKKAQEPSSARAVEDKLTTDSKTELPAPPAGIVSGFPVAGIGASTGGLAAFEAFFSGMPTDTNPNMAFVLVQHLAPDHKSMSTDLIGRFTRMQVFEVEDGMQVQPNPQPLSVPTDSLRHDQRRAPSRQCQGSFSQQTATARDNRAGALAAPRYGRCAGERPRRHPLPAWPQRHASGACAGRGGINNILKMALEGLRSSLAKSLHQVATSNQSARVMALQVKTNGHFTPVNLSVCPVKSEPAATLEASLFLVILEQAPAPVPPQAQQAAVQAGVASEEHDGEIDTRLELLKQELQSKEDYLQSTIEALETSKEELQSVNE